MELALHSGFVTATDDAHNRRRAERVAINRAFQCAGGAYVSDLSEHGLFLHETVVAPIGTDLKLRFTVLLDDPVVLEGEGRVVRHHDDPPGMGIEFTQLDPVMLERIALIVNSKRPRDSGPPAQLELESADASQRTRMAVSGSFETSSPHHARDASSTPTADVAARKTQDPR